VSNSTDLVPIINCDKSKRSGDVIFIHGLGGDARGTWQQKRNDGDSFWSVWLGEDLPNVGVWSLGYEVEPFKWKGSTMPLVDRATNTLALLDSYGIGDHPLVFIAHSLGGLLVKQMLRHALDFGTPQWKAITGQTKGIVFLSTPHSGSDIASWMRYIGWILGKSVSVKELEANHSRLRELNQVYRNHERLKRIPIEVYCEKQKTSGLLVVDESSADPGIPGVVPIPVDCNHISIAKPESRNSLIYRRVKRFVQVCLRTPLTQLRPLELNDHQFDILNMIALCQVSEQQLSESLSLDLYEVRYYLTELEKYGLIKGIKYDPVFESHEQEYIECLLTKNGKNMLKYSGGLTPNQPARIIHTNGGNYNERIEGNYIENKEI
jgi:predicted alpha/beta hydrolase family esterase